MREYVRIFPLTFFRFYTSFIKVDTINIKHLLLIVLIREQEILRFAQDDMIFGGEREEVAILIFTMKTYVANRHFFPPVTT
jgi:hypothetical protein